MPEGDNEARTRTRIAYDIQKITGALRDSSFDFRQALGSPDAAGENVDNARRVLEIGIAVALGSDILDVRLAAVHAILGGARAFAETESEKAATGVAEVVSLKRQS